MAKTYKRWSKAEDNKLLRQVEAFPHRKSWCFMVIAQELNRTPAAVQTRYYQYLNKKVQDSHIEEEAKPSLLRRIINFLGF